jgi:tetratricopeptide (TPR) repeat protein
MIVDAGTAYRNAALDENNPNPLKALSNLGACFTQLGRPQDAVEAYKAILDFFPTGVTQKRTYENLGSCYTALGQYQQAVDAFQDALRDSTYALTETGQQDYQRATMMLAQQAAPAPLQPVADLAGIDTFADGGGYAGAYQVPASPYGTPVAAVMGDDTQVYGGGNVPSAQGTGFFTATDADLIELSKREMAKERKLRHLGLKITVAIVIVIVLLLGGAIFAYWQGYGFPSQQTVIQEMFDAHANGEDVSQYWIKSSSDDADAISRIMDMVAPTSNISYDYFHTNMTKAEAVVSATLSDGGVMHYDITLTRDIIGWRIDSVNLVFASQQS